MRSMNITLTPETINIEALLKPSESTWSVDLSIVDRVKTTSHSSPFIGLLWESFDKRAMVEVP